MPDKQDQIFDMAGMVRMKLMGKGAIAVAMLSAMAGSIAPALADVKAGVDAWQQGDYARALAEWRPLAQAGDPDAQFNLAQAYKLGRGVPPDINMALSWYRKAQQQGHLRAEDNLGLLMFQQGDRAGAMPYLQKAASRDEPRAQYIVGTTLFNGDLIGKDWVRAYALMTRASSSGLPQATASLAEMDKYIPEDQRKKGLALAAAMEKGDRSVALAAAPTIPPRGAPGRTERTASPTPKPSQPARASAPAPARPAPPPSAAAKPTTQVAAAKALPTPATSGGWRVQLGAFSEDGRARALWNQVSANVSGLSAYQPSYPKAGNVTRLLIGPLASAADAARLCGRIKAAGSDCIPKKI